MNSEKPLLHVEKLQTYFHSREVNLKAVDGVSFSVKPRETLAIVGESGCGKSVTALSVMRILPKNGDIVGGKIILDQNGEDIDLTRLSQNSKQMRSIRGKDIVMVFQEPMTSFSPVYTIGNQIREMALLHRHAGKDNVRDLGINMLKKVGMPNPENVFDSYPFELSGGMRQRAMLAIALSCNPRLLIADEPTTALDVTVQAQILDLIKELQDEFDMAVVLITHDLGVVAETADNVMVMYLGKDVEYGSVRQIFHNAKHPYTQGLLASMPKLEHRSRDELEPISGNVPSLHEVPSGCPFHTRCPHFMEGTCEVKKPEATLIEKNHYTRCFLYGEGEAD